MDNDRKLLSPENIVDLNKTREAAKVLDISFEELKFFLQIITTLKDLELHNLYDERKLPIETESRLTEIDNRFHKYHEGLLADRAAIEEAIRIDPLFEEFINRSFIDLYYLNELSADARRAFEKRLEIDPEFERIALKRSRIHQRLKDVMKMFIIK